MRGDELAVILREIKPSTPILPLLQEVLSSEAAPGVPPRNSDSALVETLEGALAVLTIDEQLLLLDALGAQLVAVLGKERVTGVVMAVSAGFALWIGTKRAGDTLSTWRIFGRILAPNALGGALDVTVRQQAMKRLLLLALRRGSPVQTIEALLGAGGTFVLDAEIFDLIYQSKDGAIRMLGILRGQQVEPLVEIDNSMADVGAPGAGSR